MNCLEGEEVDEAVEKFKYTWRRQRAEVCPFDGLTVFENSAYHCDLCGGRPECVSVCTNGAIWVKTGKGENAKLNEGC
jgi:MinD superfamily P-loop ATPase